MNLFDEQREPFAVFDQLLSRMRSFVIATPSIKNATLKHGKACEKQLAHALSYGNPPTVMAMSVDNSEAGIDLGEYVCGTNYIKIEKWLVENYQGDPSDKSTCQLLIVTLLHEFLHWLQHQNKVHECGRLLPDNHFADWEREAFEPLGWLWYAQH